MWKERILQVVALKKQGVPALHHQAKPLSHTSTSKRDSTTPTCSKIL
jgi:hypothetical protein